MNITLVGPRSVGKTTLSKRLAEYMGYTAVESDALMDANLRDLGGLDAAIKAGKGDVIMERSTEVLRGALHQPCVVLDLAAGALSSPKPHRQRICLRNAGIARENSLVIGLLPYRDDQESINLLYGREKKRVHFEDTDLHYLMKKVRSDYFAIKAVLEFVSHERIYTGTRDVSSLVSESFQRIREN